MTQTLREPFIRGHRWLYSRCTATLNSKYPARISARAALLASRQAQELNVHGARVRFDRSVHVSWRDLLEAWSDLVDREIVAGAERSVLVDFLGFVDRQFSQLGPFTTLQRCEGHLFRVRRRLDAVLGQVADGPDGPPRSRLDLPGRATVKHAYLEYVESSQHIRLTLYPADTLTQARAFYTHPAAPAALLVLRASWVGASRRTFTSAIYALVTCGPQPRRRWRNTSATGASGLRPPPQSPAKTGKRSGRNSSGHGSPEPTISRSSIDQAFTNTGPRQSASPRPGLKCFYLWPLSEAKRLDDSNQMIAAVAGQLNVVLRALGEEPFLP